ncbi:MAG: Smr/MutS family protein [Treponema sp.]|jgi:DNA mismatch repair protein MutS2|nr:Smr/MutS family protein [Treponema sp.]
MSTDTGGADGAGTDGVPEKAPGFEKALRLLEYAEIMNRVAACSLSGEAAALLREERPRGDAEEVAEMKEAVSAIAARFESGDEEPRGGLPSIGFLLPRLDVEGAVLEPDEAWAIGIFVERGEAVKKWLGNTRPALPGAEASGAAAGSGKEPPWAPLPDCTAAAAAVFRILDRDGNIRDLPELRAIRRKIQNLHAELENSVTRYTAGEETRRMLQSTLPSQRDGRTVLAVKANFRGRIRGIVHEVSSSGQTVFVEPEEAVGKNNELLIERRNLELEISKLMRGLTERLAEHRENLGAFHRGIVGLECLRARARYSRDTGGRFAGESEAPAEVLVLKQARHPLLGKGAVPIDLALDGNTRTVIITGPNTGGKTVALKTAGLFALMNQSGLALPAAEGTILPVFDGVYADIGDEQSIGQSLSTFSAHIANIADIAARATGRSLVLLDELGSGTDPEEGSAIAMAVLDFLIAKNARLIVTTHHGILKNYGHTREKVENASVEFDADTLSPTYRIVMGVPGESHAVDIAARRGLAEDIVKRARSYLAEERSDVSALIRGLKEKHLKLDAAAQKSQAEELRLREERRRADLKELRLRQKETELRQNAAGRLRALLAESRKTLENLVREVREGELDREKTLRVKDFLSGLARTVEAEDAALEAEERDLAEAVRNINGAGDGSAAGPAPGRAGALVPGAEVLAGERRRRGVLVRQEKKDSWVVEIGSLKISFPERELVPLGPSKNGDAFSGGPSAPGGPRADWDADLAASPGALFEIRLLGMRLPDALESLRRQIDAAALSGLKEFSVIHGKGDGILQKGIHDYLRNDPAVADYYFSRPELGGFGRTEVVLR